MPREATINRLDRRSFLFGCLGAAATATSQPVAAWAEDALAAGEQGECHLAIASTQACATLVGQFAIELKRLPPAMRLAAVIREPATALEELGKGMIQLVAVDRPLNDPEKARYAFQVVPMAWDALAVIVHRSNRQVDLRSRQLRDIFSGRLDNWKQLDGPDRPIRIYGRAPGDSSRNLLRSILLGDGPLAIPARETDSDKAMRLAIAEQEDAIGYLSLGLVDTSVRAMAIDGVPATWPNVRLGTYRVARILYLVLPRQPSPLARQLVDWVLGRAGAAVIRRSGLLPFQA